jgi:hypothetical protein
MSSSGNKATATRKSGPPSGFDFVVRPIENQPRHGAPQTILPPAESATPQAKATFGFRGTGETNITDCDKDSTLIGLIERLWSIDQDQKKTLRQSREEKANNRAALARHLSELKSSLSGRGRDGAWLPFLRQLHIPRSTAEGLIKKHLRGNEKDKAHRVLPAFTKASIAKLLKALKPKLAPINTRELADLFVHEVAVLLDEQVAQLIKLGPSPAEDRQRPPEPVQTLDREVLVSPSS